MKLSQLPLNQRRIATDIRLIVRDERGESEFSGGDVSLDGG
jgi:hypothetical protein